MLFCHSHFCWYKRRGKELLYFLLLWIFFNKLYILKFKMFYLLSGLKNIFRILDKIVCVNISLGFSHFSDRVP